LRCGLQRAYVFTMDQAPDVCPETDSDMDDELANLGLALSSDEDHGAPAEGGATCEDDKQGPVPPRNAGESEVT
jgi:hypothetical protein